MPAPPELVLHQLLSVSGADSYEPKFHSPRALGLTRRRIPIWAIIVAVLFPIPGLLFLLMKEEDHVGIALDPLPGGTRVTIAGQASWPLQSAIQYALSGRAATPAGLPPGMVLMPPPGNAPPPPGYAAPPPPS